MSWWVNWRSRWWELGAHNGEHAIWVLDIALMRNKRLMSGGCLRPYLRALLWDDGEADLVVVKAYPRYFA